MLYWTSSEFCISTDISPDEIKQIFSILLLFTYYIACSDALSTVLINNWEGEGKQPHPLNSEHKFTTINCFQRMSDLTSPGLFNALLFATLYSNFCAM